MIQYLRTTNDNLLTIESKDKDVIDHFTNKNNNYSDVIIHQINTLKIYDEWLYKKQNLNILDCGGNIGLFALHVVDCASKIITVEPTPTHLNIMKKITKPYSNIKIEEAALSGTDEEIEFYFNTDNTTMNSIVNNYGCGTIKVKGKTLKTILDDNNMDIVDFAKIDIEGSEIKALTEQTVSEVKNRIKTWFIEAHAVFNTHTTQVRDHLNNIFNKCGYNTRYSGQDGLIVESII